jgi:YHS domain-containing protein
MTLNALARTAYELDENEFCFEPSRRVREMAVQAIRASGVVCDVGPYVATSNPMRFSSKIDLGIGTEPTSLAAETKQDLQPPEQLVARSPKPPTANTASVLPSELDRDEAFNRVQQIAARMQEDIAALDEDIDWSLFEDAPANESQGTANAMLPDETLFDFENPAPVPKPLTTPAPCLNGYCPVGLWYEQELPALPEFSSVYEERVYQFSSAAAKQQFDNDPQQFAVAYGGFDPVAYASSQTLVDGEMLRTFNGHFYAFASQENWEEFISEPELYTLHPDDLLSDEEYREQAVEDFKAIESELTQMDNNGTGFEIEQGFGSEESNQPQLLEMDLDNIEPAFDIEEYEPAPQPETASTAPATNDETQAELSFGVLEFNEAEIAEYGDIQLLAPPPVANGQTDIDTFDEEPPLELIIEDEEAPFDEATDVLSEIEKILGVRRNPVPRNRTPQTNSSPTSRLTSKRRNNVATNAERWVAPWDDKTLITRVKAVAKSKVQQERAERLLPLTTPSPRRNQRTSTTWSSLITASNKTKSLTPKRRSATASLVTHSRGDMRVDSITSGSRSRRVPTRTIDVVDLAKKRRSLSTIRPRTTSHSADLVVPNRTSESIKRSSLVRPQTNQKRERSQRIIPRASQDNSLQMRSDPARVTTITRRR